jgi:conjugative transfer signal peptidase TraF
VLFAMSFGLAAMAIPAAQRPLLIYNASASLPLGFYRAETFDKPARGEILLVWLPQTARELAARRLYLPANVQLVKPVIALGGDFVCVESDRVTVNGEAVAMILKRDRQGRSLAAWRGCRSLESDEIFLLSSAAGSFDSRYFGQSALPMYRPDWCRYGRGEALYHLHRDYHALPQGVERNLILATVRRRGIGAFQCADSLDHGRHSGRERRANDIERRADYFTGRSHGLDAGDA